MNDIKYYKAFLEWFGRMIKGGGIGQKQRERAGIDESVGFARNRRHTV